MNARSAADETPCASGVLRGNVNGARSAAPSTMAAHSRDATSGRRRVIVIPGTPSATSYPASHWRGGDTGRTYANRLVMLFLKNLLFTVFVPGIVAGYVPWRLGASRLADGARPAHG